jgi:hypothetical protein
VRLLSADGREQHLTSTERRQSPVEEARPGFWSRSDPARPLRYVLAHMITLDLGGRPSAAPAGGGVVARAAGWGLALRSAALLPGGRSMIESGLEST